MIRFYPNEQLQIKLQSLLNSEFYEYFDLYDFDTALRHIEQQILKLAEQEPSLAIYPRLTHTLKCQISYDPKMEINDLSMLTLKFWLEPKLSSMAIKEYLAKPVMKRAILFTGESDNLDAIRTWLGDHFVGTTMFNDEITSLIVQTLEGETQASIGDFIVQGIKGEFYPVKPDIFLASHDELKLQ